VQQAAQHAQAQATAAAEALAPAHRLDPADITWGELRKLLLQQSLLDEWGRGGRVVRRASGA
jgi:hypothetical protein